MQITETNIKDLIYEIRGRQVMLDSDVAKLYEYETKYVNLTVRRNIERFPEEFCFQLTKEEYKKVLRLQIATSKERENNWLQFATSSNKEETPDENTNSSQIVMRSINKHRGKNIFPMFLASKELHCH